MEKVFYLFRGLGLMKGSASFFFRIGGGRGLGGTAFVT